MPTLIGMVGLPRSGKSSYVKSLIEKGGVVVVNPDTIRLQLTGQAYVKGAEKFVWSIVEIMVRHNFDVGHTKVVLDATNVTRERRAWWTHQGWQTEWHVINTPLSVCLTRTDNTDLIGVIKHMASIYEAPTEDEGKILNING